MRSRKRVLTIIATVAALVAVSVSVALAPPSKAAGPECKVYGPLTITWVDNGHAGFCGRVEFRGPRTYYLKVSLKDAVRDGKDARMRVIVYFDDRAPYVTTYTNGTVGTWRTFEYNRPERPEDEGCFYQVRVDMSNSGVGTVVRTFDNPYC